MAKTKHLLHIINGKGIEQSVPLYTSLNDLKNRRGRKLIIGTETLYYPTGDQNDPEKTNAFIQLSDGTVEAILKTGTPEHTVKTYTVPKDKAGNTTYTVKVDTPAGISKIRFALCPAAMSHSTHWSDDGEHDFLADDYIQGSDTTLTYNGTTYSAQTEGKKKKNSFIYGCKKSFDFVARSSGGATKDFYSIPNFTKISSGRDSTGTDLKNYFYVGQINVEPNKKEAITLKIGCKTGQSQKPETCGFVLIEYGVGVE